MTMPEIKRVLLVGDARKGGSADLVSRYAAWFQERGIATDEVTDREVPLHDRDADVVVVWGGDGSLLAAARRMAENQRPTLGIVGGFKLPTTNHACRRLLLRILRPLRHLFAIQDATIQRHLVNVAIEVDVAILATTNAQR